MSAEATYPQVLAVVRELAPGWPRPLEVEYGFTSKVAAALGLDYEGARTSEWERFSRQVYRALTRMADDGVLVKGDHSPGQQRGVVWRTQSQQAAFERERAEQNAREQAETERLDAQLRRLAAFGITADLLFGRIVLGPDQLDHLMNLAAKGLG
jgi:hypothetical protein